jgi:hypothetical protein
MSQEEYDVAADQYAADQVTFSSQLNTAVALLNAFFAGSAMKLSYIFDATTTDGDPASGYLRLGSATQNTATALRLANVDGSTVNMATLIDTFGGSTNSLKGHIRLTVAGDTSKWLLFSLSAVATHSSHRDITVACVAYSAANPFTAGDLLALEFTRVGDKGDIGATGSNNFTYTARTSVSNTSLVAADFAASTRIFLDWTGSTAFTQSIAALAGIADGGYVPFKNSSTQVITIDPNGSETINGATTLKVYPGEFGDIVKEAGGLHVRGLAPSGTPVKLQPTTVASSAATLDFANVFTAEFDTYRIRCAKLKPATDAVNLLMRTSTDGGATYDSAASAYGWTYTTAGATAGGATSVTATAIQLTNSQGNATQEWASLEITVTKPLDAAYFTVSWQGLQVDDSGNLRYLMGTGMRQAAADVDSFRLLFSSGNVASGEVEVFGIRK